MIDQLVILAGGKATRLYPVTQEIAKSMVDVCGEPFIAHQLRLLKRQAIKKVIICAGFLGQQIKEFVGSGSVFGLEIEFSFDGEKLLGTGGAIKKAAALLKDDFFVMYGDSYLDIDFTPISESFCESKKSGLMTVFKNSNKWDKSNIVYCDNKIIKYNKLESSSEMEYIDFGLSVFKKRVFEEYNQIEFDLADIYKELVTHQSMAGYEVKERFYEIGSFAGLEQTKEYIAKNIKEKRG